MTTKETLQPPDAIAFIDVTRSFFPAAEGERLGLPGFGELGVDGAEEIIAPLNKIALAALSKGVNLYNIIEAHLRGTPHFSETPNFVNTWPNHSEEGTPGPLPHPDFVIAQRPELAQWFVKGREPITDPREDKSYTGAFARAIDPLPPTVEVAPDHFAMGQLFPEKLKEDGVRHAVIGGIALGRKDALLCVGSTAQDLRNQGFDVTLLLDATASLNPEDRQDGLTHLANLGIRMATTDEVIAVMNTREETR